MKSAETSGDKKPLYEELSSWLSHLWEEHKGYTALEWKIAFSVWAALLASSHVILKEQGLPLPLPPILVVAVGIIVVSVHGVLLYYLHHKLKHLRKEIEHIKKLIRSTIPVVEWEEKHPKLGRISACVQITITAGLSLMFCWLVIAKSNLPPNV